MLIRLLACLLLPLTAGAQAERPAPTFDDVLSGRLAYRSWPQAWRWEGNRLARRGRRGWEAVDPASGRVIGPVAPADLSAHAKGLAGVTGWPERGGRRLLQRAQRGDGWVLASHAGAVFVHRTGTPGRRLVDKGARLALASGDGRRAAWVSGFDLVVADCASGSPRAVTTGGHDGMRSGIFDWVYQEELYGRGRWRSFWWGPTGRHLAFLRLDGRRVPTHPIVDLRRMARLVQQRYPKAGQANPIAQVGIADVDAVLAGKAPEACVRWVNLARYGAEMLVVRVDWSPDGRLWLCVQDRAQTWLELLVVDPATGQSRRVLREQVADAWVSRPPAPHWLKGGFLWQSSETGYRHLYLHDRDGTRVRAVTAGEWRVRGLARVDEAARRVYFTGTADGATQHHLYRASLDATTVAPTRLTQGDGWHSPRLSPDGKWILDSFSSVSQVPVVQLLDASGKVVRVLHRTAPPALMTHRYVAPSLMTLRARDGYPLDACAIVPAGTGPHPVFVRTYSGPGAMSVRNRWYGDTWDQFLVGQGIAVLRVNVRSASGRGMAHRKACYRDLGASELRDLVDAVAAFGKRPEIDAGRVGIAGSSYGGFMAAYALTHSDRFAVGLAISGVYDWRLYDTIYTERYMNTPKANAAGYASSSVVKAAGRLTGRLLIAHGTLDDNVHVQNAIQLVDALQKAGKDFELALYPGAGHGIGAPGQRRDLRVRMWRALRETLLAGK